MKKTLLTIIAIFMAISLFAQEKNVAVIAPFDMNDKVESGYETLIKSKLTEAIAEAPNYKAFTRTEIDAIIDEHHFQRTGQVKDDEIRKIGEMTGATHICVSKLDPVDNGNYITMTASIIKIETAEVETEKSVFVEAKPGDINKACIKLANKLVGRVGEYTMDPPSGSSSFTEQVAGVNIEMVAVEGGSFEMGCTSEQTDCDDDESPVHTVSVDDFYIGKYEVTHEQFIAFLNDAGVSSSGSMNGNELIDMDDEDCAVSYSGGSFYFSGSGYASSKTCPVIEVTWYGAQAYCEWLNRKTGKNYRLPTEAEWEYAARGGNGSKGYKYSGSNIISSVAWYDDNSNGETHPVGQKQPNELGIYDMSGNVWEWCIDWYDSNYYSSSPRNNPAGPSSGSYRVLRGGSWRSNARDCRVANRGGSSPGRSLSDLGFRLVLSSH